MAARCATLFGIAAMRDVLGRKARGHRAAMRSFSVPRSAFFAAERLESRRLMSAVTATQFTINSSALASGIAAGPDGSVWFTEPSFGGNLAKIGRISAAGVYSEFTLPARDSGPQFICAGPDGNLWFSESLANKIGRITPSGAVQEFAIPTAGSNPQGIVAGPDGRIWFTEFGSDKIGAMTTAGAVTEYRTPASFVGPLKITVGGDGNLWYTGFFGDLIGYISPDGVVSGTVNTPTQFSSPRDLTAGPDGNIWFTESATDKIGRLKLPGLGITEYQLPWGTSPHGIVAGGDGNLYFAAEGTSGIGRITPSGAVSFLSGLGQISNPSEMAIGADGNLWSIEGTVNQIDRINLFPTVGNFSAGVAQDPVAGVDFNGQVATFTSSFTDSLPSDFLATVDWGDGTAASPAAITKGANGVSSVTAEHTYADPTPGGSPATLAVTILRPDGSHPVTATAAVVVDGPDGPLPLPPTVSIGDVQQPEGNSGASAFTFTLTRTGDTSAPASVAYSTADVTATAVAADYQTVADIVSFDAGEVSKQITVFVNGNRFAEPDKTFRVELSSPVDTRIGDGTGVGTILNDDHAPVVVADKYTTTKDQPVIVSAAGVLANDSDADGDPLSASLLQSPANGSVVMQPDGSFIYTPKPGYVGNDSFSYQATDGVNWSSAASVNISMSPPPPPGLSVADVSVSEGNSGTKTITFAVTRTGSTAAKATVHFATANGTATSGSDYTAASGTLTFNPGVSLVSKSITITGDTSFEVDETFKFVLSSASGATIVRSTAVGTILNDDVAPPKISITGVTASEGASGQKAFTFTVKLDKASTKSISVKFATADGTAKSSSDYVATSGTLTFAAGQVSKTITVFVKGDKTRESNESFLVKLSSAVNATIGTSQATGAITNDD